MPDFQAAYNKVLKPNEGYWVNSPIDRGGETYMGIARNFDKDWEGWPVIDKWKRQYGTPPKGKPIPVPGLTEMVYRYFEKKYWKGNNLQLITDQNCATLALDMVVLHGRGKKVINRAILTGAAAKRNSIGADTVKAINADPKKAYFRIIESRLRYFKEIVANDPTQQGNMKGWINNRYTPFLKPKWPFTTGETVAGGAGLAGIALLLFVLVKTLKN